MYMFKAMKILILSALLSTFLCASTYGKPVLDIEKKGMQYELVDKIQISELWELLPRNHTFTKYNGGINFWFFANESYFYKGKMKVALLVVAGMGDIAEKPVALKLWIPIRNTIYFNKRKTETRQLETRHSMAVFCTRKADVVENKKFDPCIEIEINPVSESVYLDGHLIGKIQDRE